MLIYSSNAQLNYLSIGTTTCLLVSTYYDIFMHILISLYVFLSKPFVTALKIALVQMSVGPDKQKNISEAVKQIYTAKQAGAQLVALPECFNSPYGTSKN